MKIVIEGCGHGALDKIYEAIALMEKQEGIKVDLLICCGDFQATRNKFDLDCMAVPPKYKHMGDFYHYYTGVKVAPILTLFIHGNHEAGNHLQELYLGGWVCPNIYYMGYSSIVQFGGVRIGGISGIWKGRYYKRGYYEQAPYTAEELRSVYYIREYETEKPIDIFLSHDWPRNVYHHGNLQTLLRNKPFFAEEVHEGTLGNPAAEELLYELQPKYWFSAHLHVKFPAVVVHKGDDLTGQKNVTKFLSLDKCLPRRDYLQLIDIPDVPGFDKKLRYDEEWLAILRATLPMYSTNYDWVTFPNQVDLTEAREFVANLASSSPIALDVPNNFIPTAPAYPDDKQPFTPLKPLQNPQTQLLIAKLGLNPGIVAVYADKLPDHQQPRGYNQHTAETASRNPDEIDIEDMDDFGQEELTYQHQVSNPDEIQLDDESLQTIRIPLQGIIGLVSNPDEINLDDM